MTSQLTREQRSQYRKLSREGDAKWAKIARGLLDADHESLDPGKRHRNAAVNVARGHILSTPTQTGAAVDQLARRMTPKNGTPTKKGASAAARAAISRGKANAGKTHFTNPNLRKK